MTDVLYDVNHNALEAALWASIAAKYALIGDAMTYREFIAATGKDIVAFRQLAWRQADADLAAGLATVTALPVRPIGYQPSSVLTSRVLAEQTTATVLNNVANSKQVSDAFAKSKESGIEARKVAQETRLNNYARSQVSDSYRMSQGTGVATWTKAGMVNGYRRQTTVSCCPWCASLAKGIYPGDYHFPMHPNDRCIRVPVTVPLEQIHERWRDGYAQRLAGNAARRQGDEAATGYTQWEYDTTAPAAEAA